MKKTFLIIIAIMINMIFSYSVSAGDFSGKGIKVGLNFANVYGSGTEFTKNKIGFIGGGFLVYNFTNVLGIQPELLYSMKGFKEAGIPRTDAAGNEIETSPYVSLSYIEIPILFKYIIPMQDNFKFNIFIGPNADILIDSKYDLIGLGSISDAENKNIDFGLTMGIGCDFIGIDKGKITTEARIDIGFVNIFKDDSGVLYSDSKNKVFSIILGYSL